MFPRNRNQIHKGTSRIREHTCTPTRNQTRNQAHKKNPMVHAQEFTLFDHLPREIRCCIWRFASDPQNITLCWQSPLLPNPFVDWSKSRVPSPLRVCRESRAELLRHYTLFDSRVDRTPEYESQSLRLGYINWALDTIVIPSPMYFKRWATKTAEEELQKIHSIAIGGHRTYFPFANLEYLTRFSNLNSISVCLLGARMSSFPYRRRKTVDPTTEYTLLLTDMPEHSTWETLSKGFEHQFEQKAPEWLPLFNGLKLFDTWDNRYGVDNERYFIGEFPEWTLMEEK